MVYSVYKFRFEMETRLGCLENRQILAKVNSDHHKFCYDMEVMHRMQTNLAIKVTIQVTTFNECSLE